MGAQRFQPVYELPRLLSLSSSFLCKLFSCSLSLYFVDVSLVVQSIIHQIQSAEIHRCPKSNGKDNL